MLIPIAPLLVLAGVGALILGRKKVKCPQGTSGGVLDDIIYKEIVTGGADPEDNLPMIIAFHGRYGEPDDIIPTLSILNVKARIIFPQACFKDQGKYYWWKMAAKDPDQARLAERMVWAMGILDGFIKDIPRCRPTIGKPLVVGHSQGGMVAYLIATRRPDLISAAIPAAGWLPEELWSPSTAPIYAVHGRGDATVPFDRTADYVAKMREHGADQIWLREVTSGHGLSGELRLRWLDLIKFTLRRGHEEWGQMGHPFG